MGDFNSTPEVCINSKTKLIVSSPVLTIESQACSRFIEISSRLLKISFFVFLLPGNILLVAGIIRARFSHYVQGGSFQIPVSLRDSGTAFCGPAPYGGVSRRPKSPRLGCSKPYPTRVRA